MFRLLVVDRLKTNCLTSKIIIRTNCNQWVKTVNKVIMISEHNEHHMIVLYERGFPVLGGIYQ